MTQNLQTRIKELEKHAGGSEKELLTAICALLRGHPATMTRAEIERQLTSTPAPLADWLYHQLLLEGVS